MNTGQGKKPATGGMWLTVALLVLLFLVGYLSLNLAGVDYGYELESLRRYEKSLREELNRLEAKRASLLNLERVEKAVTESLGYQYPEPDQIIKVFEDEP